MRMDSRTVEYYFMEYSFWKQINDYNQRAMDVANHGENADPQQVIHVTQARRLHDELKRDLANEGTDMSHAKMSEMFRIMNSRMPRLGFDASDYAGMVKDVAGDFSSMLGLKRARDGKGYVTTGRRAILPISPYDDYFRHMDRVMGNGSKLGGVLANDNIRPDRLNRFYQAVKATYVENVHPNLNGGFSGRMTNKSLVSKEDITGLSLLRPYMTSDEYEQAKKYINQSFNINRPNEVSPEEMTRIFNSYHQMASKAVYILKHLRSEGYTYKIGTDRRLGQLKATIDNTSLSVRIMDSPKNMNYVGKTYDRGVNGAYVSTRGRNKSWSFNATNEQAMDLVNYALGRRVYVRDANGKPTKMPVGQDNILTRMITRRNVNYNAAYHQAGGLSAVEGPFLVRKGQADRYGNMIRMHFDASHQEKLTDTMRNADDADNYLQASIASARNNMNDRINALQLIEDADKAKDDPDFEPRFDADPLISDIQQGIWDTLTGTADDGKKNVLLKPGVTEEDLLDATDKINNGEMDISELSKYQYDPKMEPKDMVSQYAKDCAAYYVGQFDKDTDGKRFNPANVIRYQTSEYGIYRNRDNMIKALRMAKIDPDTLRGDDIQVSNFKNELIQFDEDSAVPMSQKKSPFMQNMYKAIMESLNDNGMTFDPADIKIDKHGIVQYKGSVALHERIKSRSGDTYDNKKVTGLIGQIFEPKQEGLDKGVLYTNFGDGTPEAGNYAVVPGYTATILPEDPNHPQTVEERSRLTGYEQLMLQNIRYQLRQDFVMPTGVTAIGSPTNVNKTYRKLYGTHKDMDFVKQYQDQKMPEDEIKAIIRAEGEKVRYSNNIRDNSTVNAEYRAQKYGYDVADDINADAYNLTDNRNMSILTKESDGYFDPIASNATTTNQGIAKFLVDGAKIDESGKIIPGPKTGKGSRMALMNTPEAAYVKYNPFDRQNMTISNWLQADSMAPAAHVALTTLNGWNQDDGVVVSKKFAETQLIRDANGKLRHLHTGDKILDMNGNKGVINLIVDPEMKAADAKKAGLTDEVKFFKNNPKLDVVMAPFSAASRYNGGTARQLMRHPETLVDDKGNKIPAAMGVMPMIITNKAADVKTKVYNEDDIQAGKGRKVSAQLAWQLDSKGAKNILHEAFGRNGGAMTNLNEYLNVMGMSIDNVGQLHDEPVKTARNIIKQPELVFNNSNKVSYKATEKNLAQQLNQEGGLMEMPFDIKLANGKTTKNVPVLSSYLRSGQELQDGTMVIHDYTHQYQHMFDNGVRYRANKLEIDRLSNQGKLDKKDQKHLDNLRRNQQILKKEAQNSYDDIANNIKNKVLTGKHNIFKDKLMSHRMPHSATSIWTADPRLDIETIGMGPKMAETLHIKDGGKALIWRDPALRDGALRYMRVKVDPRLTGISINPSMDKSFDGDFDGDTIGIVNLSTHKAKQEANKLYSVRNNLLDYGTKNPDGTHPLYMQHSLDVMVACAKHPELEDRWQKLTKDVNKFEKDYSAGKINKAQVDMDRLHAVQHLDKYFGDVYKDDVGPAINYGNVRDHLKSLKQVCIDTGAKGNMTKFQDYAKWLGAKMTVDKKGNVDWATVKDTGDTLATRKMQQETMKATAIKSFGTGIAGGYSQRAIKALRNVAPKAALELTYPVTQSVLQVKHDPEEAVKKYDMLMDPVRKLWNGYAMTREANGWQPVRDPSTNKPKMATTHEWAQAFHDMYTEDLNVDPNPDFVQDVAYAMADPKMAEQYYQARANHDKAATDTLKQRLDQMPMKGIEDATTISPMDRLAYSGKFVDIVDEARKGENLFAGKYNQDFASDKLRDNIVLKRQQLTHQQEIEQNLSKGKAVTFTPDDSKKLKDFEKSDVLAGQHRNMARTTRAVQESVEQETQAEEQEASGEVPSDNPDVIPAEPAVPNAHETVSGSEALPKPTQPVPKKDSGHDGDSMDNPDPS